MAEYLDAYAVEDYDEPFGIHELVPFPLYDSTYYALRQVLRPEYRNLSNAQIEALLETILSGMSPEEVEGFWDTVKSVAGEMGGALKQAAPVVLPLAGAAVGTYFGGPAGTAIGSQLGQMGAQLISPSKPPTPTPTPTPATPVRSSVSMPLTPPPAAAPSAAAAPADAPVPAGGTSAVGQLLSLIQNPAFLKSLLGQVLGLAGQQTVPAGSQGTQINFGAIMNALSSLAGRAAQEATEAYADAEGVDSTAYLVGPDGNFLVDPADPDARAQRLLELLQEDSGTGAYDPVTDWLIEANLLT